MFSSLLYANNVCFHSGYSALFRHPNNELNYCVYIIPGNPLVTDDKLPYWHEYLSKEDPNISKALGKKAKIERMKAGKFLTIMSLLCAAI